MAKINGKRREVLDKAEWVAITSLGSDGPPIVATWGDHLMNMGPEDHEVIVIPAGDYYKTEKDLRENSQVELLSASEQVEGSHFLCQGCTISGKGELQSTGKFAAVARERFLWARGALVIKVEMVTPNSEWIAADGYGFICGPRLITWKRQCFRAKPPRDLHLKG